MPTIYYENNVQQNLFSTFSACYFEIFIRNICRHPSLLYSFIYILNLLVQQITNCTVSQKILTF